MSYDFNADDVFEMAEQIERNGAKFYKDAAAGISDPDAKKMLLTLSEMEVVHEKIFAKLRADLTAKEQEKTVFDPEGEAAQYLKSLADTRVFFQKELPQAADYTDRSEAEFLEAILKSAIEAEKDSIVFYLGMKDMVPEKYGKDRMDAIIREEMSHIQILSRELMNVKK